MAGIRSRPEFATIGSKQSCQKRKMNELHKDKHYLQMTSKYKSAKINFQPATLPMKQTQIHFHFTACSK